MKILHICLANYYSDNHSYQENILPIEHQKLGYQVEIIASTEVYDDNQNISYVKSEDYLTETGIPISRLPYINLFPSFLSRKLRIYKDFYCKLEKSNPDIIFIHDVQFLDSFKLVRYIKFLRKFKIVKVYADCHADFSNSARNIISLYILHKIIYKMCALRLNTVVDIFWGVMPRRMLFLNNIYGIPENKIKLLNLGAEEYWMNLAANKNLVSKFKSKYDIPSNSIIFTTGGKIDKYKTNTLMIMKYFSKFRNTNIYLVIFGSVSDDIFPEFNNILSGNSNIIFLGWLSVSNTQEILLLSDFGIFPGRHSVLWEQSVALGLPLILYNNPDYFYLNHNNNVVFLDSLSDFDDVTSEIVSKNLIDYYKLSALSESRFKFSYSKIAKLGIEIE